MKNDFLKAAGHFLSEKAGMVLRDPIYRCLVGAALVGTFATSQSYRQQELNETSQATAFSEIEDTRFKFKMKNQTPPALTHYLSVTNDVVMKEVEARNAAMKKVLSRPIYFGADSKGEAENKYLAQEYEFRVDPSFRYHGIMGDYNEVADYAKVIGGLAEDALKSLDKIVQAEKDLPAVIDALSKTWDHSSEEVGHYEPRPVYGTVCDSDGKNCRTEQTGTTQEWVVDYYIQHYTYDKKSGERASQLLNDFIAKHPDLEITEKLVLATKTEAENEQAIRSTLKDKFNGREPTTEEYLAHTNSWATGSNFMLYKDRVVKHHGETRTEATKWAQHKKTARSDKYKTNSRYDDGPKEFQTVQRALSAASSLNATSHKITDGIRFAAVKIPEMSAKMEEMVAVVNGRKPGNASKLKRDIRQISTEVYNMNFEGGFDTRPFKTEMVVLFGFLGAIGGAAAAAGAGHLYDRRTGFRHRRRNQW